MPGALRPTVLPILGVPERAVMSLMD